MELFCKETRHRAHEIDEAPRKFICTQLPSFVDYALVFPFISNDLESINFRAPGILDSYANMRHVSPKLLGELISHPENLKKALKVPVFNDFVAKVQPPVGKELLAFFAPKKKNLLEHVESLTSNTDEQKRLFNVIQSYQIPSNLDMKQVITSLGNFLADMIIGEHEEEEIEEEEPEKVEEEVELEKEIKLPIKDSTPMNETDYWENPVLKAFKIDAGLSTRFSSEKTVKQVLVSSCAPHMNEHLELGKTQTEIPNVSIESIEHFPLSYFDHLPSETIGKIVSMDQCQELYHGLSVKPAEGRELVKTLFTLHHPELCKFVQTFKNFKKNDKIDNQIISLILDASSCSPPA